MNFALIYLTLSIDAKTSSEYLTFWNITCSGFVALTFALFENLDFKGTLRVF